MKGRAQGVVGRLEKAARTSPRLQASHRSSRGLGMRLFRRLGETDIQMLETVSRSC